MYKIAGVAVVGIFLVPALAGAQEEITSGIRRETRVTRSGIVEERTVYIKEREIPMTISDEPGSVPSRPLTPTHLYKTDAETTVVWVDRDHLYAIARYSTISGEGMHIFTNWELNNERASLYFSPGASVPLWSYSAPNEFVLQLGSSWNAGVLAAGDLTMGYRWSRASSSPVWVHDFGEEVRAASVSSDGSKVVYLTRTDAGGHIYTLCAETGTVLWDYGWTGRSSSSLALSTDGSVAAVLTYDSCHVFDQFGQRGEALRVHGSQFPSQVDLSGDGNLLVFGDYRENLRLYEWKGVDYELKWTAKLGTSPFFDWVMAVAISQDGSTIFAGTANHGDRDDYVAVYDTASNIPLWTSHRYGHTIHSVDLSADGSMGIVGCGGDPDVVNGFGDAISVFNMADSIPILSVSDAPAHGGERGSITSVAISDCGTRAVASGKAVRTYEFGNGGQVYSIHIGAIMAHHVGVIGIISPPKKLMRDSTYTVRMTCRNHGQAPASFWTYFTILDSLGVSIYKDSVEVVDIPAGFSLTVSYDSFTPVSYGWYKMKTWTALTGDDYPGDDTLYIIAWCKHDVAVERIDNPFYEVTVNQLTPVVATVKNIGTHRDTIVAITTIRDVDGVLVYSDTLGTLLSPDESAVLHFSDWVTGSVRPYTVYTTVFTHEDYDTMNNLRSKSISSRYEIMYDDGSADGWWIVGGDYHENRFAVRFTPVIDTPMTLVSARVYVLWTEPFALSIHRDSLGLPGDMLLGPDTVAAVSSPDWVEVVYAHPLPSTDDFWVVFHWLSDTPNRPWVGADYNYPSDMRSWWHALVKGSPEEMGGDKRVTFTGKAGWRNVIDADWMIRALVTPPAAPDIVVSPDSLHFEIAAGAVKNRKEAGSFPRARTSALIVPEVEISAGPVTGSNISLPSAYLPTFSTDEPETLRYDDGSFETGIGLAGGDGHTPGHGRTFGFATRFSHFPTNLYNLLLYFTEFTGTSFRLYVWGDQGGVPNSGVTPYWVDMNIAAPTPGDWFSISLDTVPVPDPFWIGVIYNYIGPSGAPDWRIGVDQSTVDPNTYGNLSGRPDGWEPMSGMGWGYAFGIRAVIGGIGIIPDTAQMWVKNTGVGLLSVTGITWDGPWIESVSPLSFTVPEGDSIPVTVIATNAGLPDGVYYDTLLIVSDDPDEPIYNQPCVLVITLVGVEETETLSRFEFFPLYPSPMISDVRIAYSLPQGVEANLRIYDISGRLIRRFEQISNDHSPIIWDGKDRFGNTVAAGIYFCSLYTSSARSTRKIVKIR